MLYPYKAAPFKHHKSPPFPFRLRSFIFQDPTRCLTKAIAKTAQEDEKHFGTIHGKTTVAMENPNHKWRFIAGKIIYFYGPFSMAMLNNQRVCI